MSAAVSVMSFMMLMVMVGTLGIRIILKLSSDKRLRLLIRRSGSAGIQLDAGFCKRASRAAAYPSADQHIHAVVL